MPVYPCSGIKWTYRSRICKIQKETNQRTADRSIEKLQWSSTGIKSSKCSKAVHPVFRGGQQTADPLDVNFENGMGISVGRLREDTVYDWKFVGLSHNTVRGAAGGAVLCAELLKAQGYITKK